MLLKIVAMGSRSSRKSKRGKNPSNSDTYFQNNTLYF